jgi:hypothetical protein
MSNDGSKLMFRLDTRRVDRRAAAMHDTYNMSVFPRRLERLASGVSIHHECLHILQVAPRGLGNCYRPADVELVLGT